MPTANTLNDWFATTQGEYLLAREQAFFDHSVVDIFGFNALQIGLSEHEFLRASRIPLRIIAGNETGMQVLHGGARPPGAEAAAPHAAAQPTPHANDGAPPVQIAGCANMSGVLMDVDELPFECDALDLVLLPHVLEFNAHPHQILREVERVLRPEGSVIISGFNPRSLWGMRRMLGSKTGYPWCGNFIALPRLKDWLALLGFEVAAGRFACYAPPLANPGLLKRFRFMEPAGDRWWAICGGVYFLQAIKRVPGMRLIKPQWNEGLVSKLLPAAPKLNREVSQRTRAESR